MVPWCGGCVDLLMVSALHCSLSLSPGFPFFSPSSCSLSAPLHHVPSVLFLPSTTSVLTHLKFSHLSRHVYMRWHRMQGVAPRGVFGPCALRCFPSSMETMALTSSAGLWCDVMPSSKFRMITFFFKSRSSVATHCAATVMFCSATDLVFKIVLKHSSIQC